MGAYLFEFEQSGEDRASYGKRLVSALAVDLKKRKMKGLGLQHVEDMPPVLSGLSADWPIVVP